MSEAVEAEIIEPEEASELTVAYSPAVIEANFDALEAHVRRLVADYEGATYDMGKDENVKAAKRDRAYLNGIAKEIDERRKAVSREYTKPLAAFEDRCKAVAGIAKQAADGIKAQLDEAEEERQLRARTPSCGSTTRSSPGCWPPSCPMSVSTRSSGPTRPSAR